MLKWEAYEKHDGDVRLILKQLGCMDNKNQLRAWKAAADIALEQVGHTSIAFKDCKCSKGFK